MQSENYAENNLNNLSRLRGILKRECKDMQMKNFWVLDGVGSLLGVTPGTSAGSNREVLPDLRPAVADDGVHLTPTGNRNLASCIAKSITGLKTGTLTKDAGPKTVTIGPGNTMIKPEFYWRGFRSPVGDALGRSRNTPTSGPATGPDRRWRGGRGHSAPTPYARQHRQQHH
jgi:hypothetical protein